MSRCLYWFAPLICSLVTVTATEPIATHPDNPHRFLWRGQPTVLVGASRVSYREWSRIGDDYVHLLDDLQGDGLNVVRIWNPTSHWQEDVDHQAFLFPWARSTTPGARDGGARFDLDAWDADYFARLRGFVRAASDRGIAVELSLFNGYGGQWDWSPLRAGNNIQGVGSGSWSSFMSLSDAALLSRQVAMLRQVVSELRTYDNVIFEVMNEPNVAGGSDRAGWHRRMIAEYRTLQQELGNTHLIGVNEQLLYGDDAPDVYHAHYTYWSGHVGAFELLDQRSDRGRPLVFNEAPVLDHWGSYDPADGRVEAWEFLLGGGSCYDGLISSWQKNVQDPTSPWNGSRARQYRGHLGVLHRFLSSLDIVRTRRDTTSVVAGGADGIRRVRAISDPGVTYAVFIHHSERTGNNDHNYRVKPGTYSLGVSLDLPAGTYTWAWIEPTTGAVRTSGTVTHGGGSHAFAPPTYTVDIALRVLRSGDSDDQAPTVATPASASPSPVTGTTAALSVLGADDGGEATLTYTWTTTGTPPAGVVFAPNGSNAAQQCTATFTKAGSYQLRVTISDASGRSATSSVDVTVVQSLSSMVVGP